MKKLTAVVLALVLALSPAAVLAADVAALFPATRAAVSFPDVPKGAWYESAATLCYETGLLNGTGTGFSPNGTVSIAEAATLAARMHGLLNGGDGVLPAAAQGQPWYVPAVTYMEGLGVSGFDQPERSATRQDFFVLLSTVLTADLLAPINSITALPDTSNADVLVFYNAGILTGTDGYGTFSGNKTLTRAEMAAMTARIVRPALRLSFTPQPVPGGDTVFATLNGQSITRQQFIAALEAEFASVGFVVDWTADYNVGDLNTYFRNRAMSPILSDLLAVQFAATYGLPHASLAEAYDSISALFAGAALRAKHILFKTVDENRNPLPADQQAGALQKAELFLEVLQYTPTEAKFDELMNGYSEDEGLADYPNGYVFGEGEMVEPFEAAVLALSVGDVSGIVQTSFGYHIILRLDPQGDPEGLEEFLSSQVIELLNSLFQQSDYTTTPAFDAFDCRAYYATWLARQ